MQGNLGHRDFGVVDRVNLCNVSTSPWRQQTPGKCMFASDVQVYVYLPPDNRHPTDFDLLILNNMIFPISTGCQVPIFSYFSQHTLIFPIFLAILHVTGI